MPRRFSGPLLPGTTSVRQVNRRNRYAKKGKFVPTAALRKSIKNISINASETKRSNQYTEDPAQLFHNKAYYAGQLLATSQGTADPQGLVDAKNNRIGDEVYAKGLHVKFFLANAARRPNVNYRIVLFSYNTQYVQTGALDDSEFWSGTDGAGANMNRMLDKPNTDRIKVLKSIVLKPSHEANYSIDSGMTYSEKTRTVSMYMPFKNRKIRYNEDNSPFPLYRDIGIMVLAYDTMTSLETDLIGSFQWTSTFYYKDP